jgi:hypothetical protein
MKTQNGKISETLKGLKIWKRGMVQKMVMVPGISREEMMA